MTFVQIVDEIFAPKLSLFAVLGGLATGQALADGDYVLAALLLAVALATVYARKRFTPRADGGTE